MKQGCFSTAGTLTESFIVGAVWWADDVMLVNLKGQEVTYSLLHSVLVTLSSSDLYLGDVKKLREYRCCHVLSLLRMLWHWRSLGFKCPPNYMHYVSDGFKIQQWVQNYKAHQVYYLLSATSLHLQSHPAVVKDEKDVIQILKLVHFLQRCKTIFTVHFISTFGC